MIVECEWFTRILRAPGIDYDNIRSVLSAGNNATRHPHVSHAQCIHTRCARIAMAFSGVLVNRTLRASPLSHAAEPTSPRRSDIVSRPYVPTKSPPSALGRLPTTLCFAQRLAVLQRHHATLRIARTTTVIAPHSQSTANIILQGVHSSEQRLSRCGSA